ncbi:hypothetical protein QBZ16_001332 [Prototheca wickerhamii]|uniref:Phosphoribosyltransferase domain-containing protein n=1 Tax=Prototheca wickerhamii TaxID=3111 RepID=A0AAD9IDE3_PROWI|nr:hypothetical protein QBZ16_001332 [Prototheca wickerhamii]
MGRHVVIVDDLVQSGGTLLECQRLLFDHGAEAVSAYATHGVFPREAWKLFEPADGLAGFKYEYVWITDSCPETAEAVRDQAPFELLTLAGPIAAALQSRKPSPDGEPAPFTPRAACRLGPTAA